MPLDWPEGAVCASDGPINVAAPAKASAEQTQKRSLRPLMPPLSASRSPGQPRRWFDREAQIHPRALPRVALDVGREGALARVLALLDVDLLAARVVDGRRGSADRRVDEEGDVLAGIGVAGIGDRELVQELLGRRVRVPGVHPDEGDPLAAPGSLALEPGHLLAAGPAPRCPLVDH